MGSRFVALVLLWCVMGAAWAQQSPQTVRFTTHIPATSAAGGFLIGAEASSGLPVTFATAGVCSVGSFLTLNAVSIFPTPGVCTITASQAGNETYEPASVTAQVDVTWTVKHQYVTGPDLTGEPVTVRIYYDYGGMPAMDTACAIDWQDPHDPGPQLGTLQDDGVYRYCDFTHAYSAAGNYAVPVVMYDARYGYEMRVAYYDVRTAPGWTVLGEATLAAPQGAFAVNPELAGTVTARITLRDPTYYPEPSSAVFSLDGSDVGFRVDGWSLVQSAPGRVRIAGFGVDHDFQGFSFELELQDGGVSGADRLRLRLFYIDGSVAFDNQPGAPADAPPATILGGGFTFTP